MIIIYPSKTLLTILTSGPSSDSGNKIFKAEMQTQIRGFQTPVLSTKVYIARIIIKDMYLVCIRLL